MTIFRLKIKYLFEEFAKRAFFPKEIFLLIAICTFSLTTECLARSLNWQFVLIAGRNGDVGFGTHKRVCFPDDFGGFVVSWPAGGDPIYSDQISLTDGEHAKPQTLSVALNMAQQPETCIFQAQKQAPTDTQVCVDFWINTGPRGAQVCEGKWALHLFTDK